MQEKKQIKQVPLLQVVNVWVTTRAYVRYCFCFSDDNFSCRRGAARRPISV